MVIDPRWTLVSDSRWRGVNPAPGAEVFRRAEPGDVTELSGERSAEDRADTVDLLDGLIAGVALEYRSDPSIQFGDPRCRRA